MNEGAKKKINVLILDDEEYVLKLAEREFRDEPYGFAGVTDPEEAMRVLKEEDIKVVISDQRMPRTTGIEFLTRVKEQYPETIRVLFSGYQDIQVTEAAINIGQVYRYVTKPWAPGTLGPVVQQSLQTYDLAAENRDLVRFLGVKNNELNALNNGLTHMVARQKQFASIVSHELRTPLASINSTLDLMLSRTPGKLNEDQEKFLGKARHNVSVLNQLVDEMLDISKIDVGWPELKKVTCGIKEIIEDVVDNLSGMAKSKKLTLEGRVPGGLPPVYIDTNKVARVLKNLINNAVKFTEQGGIVVSGTYEEARHRILVCIEDTGKGILEEDREKLFSKFSQVGEGRGQAGSTGLGLAISQEIIDLHGGEIWVESEYGKGSRFCFTLPVREKGA